MTGVKIKLMRVLRNKLIWWNQANRILNNNNFIEKRSSDKIDYSEKNCDTAININTNTNNSNQHIDINNLN